MLPCKNCSRAEESSLLAVEHTLEGCPQGYLCFAEAHVAAEQSVHWDRLFHIGLYLAYRTKLILGFLVVEAFLKLSLPVIIGREGIALCRLPFCVQLGELLCHILHSGANLISGAFPFVGVKLIELYAVIVACSDVSGNKVKLSYRHIKHVCSCVFYSDIVLGRAVCFYAFYAVKLAYAVHSVNYKVISPYVGKAFYFFSCLVSVAAFFRSHSFLLSYDSKLYIRVVKAARERACSYINTACGYLAVLIKGIGVYSFIGEVFYDDRLCFLGACKKHCAVAL